MEIQAEHHVRITHPDKLLWPDSGVTKLDYIRYLIDVAPSLLPHLANRPLTLIRYPDGIKAHAFYQKDKPQGTPSWVKTTPIWSTDRNAYMHAIIADSVSTLIWLGNLGGLEFHTGFSTLDAPDRPTAVVFDLDPSVPGFESVRTVALTLHRLLEKLDIPSVVKTSGATGLQVFIPVVRGVTFDETRVFTTVVAEYLVNEIPRLVTVERLKRRRGDKVYIDYLQHGAGRTLISVYSARGVPTANVSTPVTWTELEEGILPEDFTVHNVAERVKDRGDLMQEAEPIDMQSIIQFFNRHTTAAL
jgi:bifunctional non-homologous end joining protein LigD